MIKGSFLFRRKPITIRASLIRSFVVLILMSSLSVLIFMSIRAYRTERELSVRLIENGSQQTAQELDRFFQPATRGAVVAAFWGRNGKLDLDQVIAGKPQEVNQGQRQAAVHLNTFLLPLVQQLSEVSSLQVANARGDGFLILELPSGEVRNRVVSRERWGNQTLWFEVNKEGGLESSQWRTLDYDPRQRSWYRGLKDRPDGEVYWTEPYVFYTTKDLGITASIKWRHRGLTQIIAYDVLLTTLTHFTQSDALQLSKHSQVAIFTEKWQAIGLPRHKKFASKASIRQAFLRPVGQLETPEFEAAVAEAKKNAKIFKSLQESHKAFFPFSFQGENWWAGISAYHLGKARNLWTVVLVPNRDLLEGLAEQRIYLLIATIVALAAALLYSLLLARMYSRPLEALASQSRRIRDLDFRLDEKIEARLQEFSQLREAQEQSLIALQSFARYVPLEVVKQLVAKGEVARIGGRNEELTILFTDIAGFTGIAESLDPESLTRHMAEYFQTMIDVLQESRATVDKIVGDAILAFWGAPNPIPNQAEQAVKAVLECCHKLEEANADWLARGLPPLPTRFGLTTGPVVVGNIGARTRLAYTVLGDAVNLASRLENSNKVYGTKILADENTREASGGGFAWRRLDRIVVVGKTEPTYIFELLGEVGKVSQEVALAASLYEEAWERYRARDFDQALQLLSGFDGRFGDDPAVRRLRQRCVKFKEDPPPDDWDGVVKMTMK